MVASGRCSRARDIHTEYRGREECPVQGCSREGRQGRGWIIYIDHDTKIYDYKQLGEDEGLWKYGNCNQHPAATNPSTPPSPTYRQGCSGDTQSPELSHSQIRATVSQKAQTANTGARKCCTVRSWRLAARRR